MALFLLFFFGFFSSFVGSITPSMLNMTALKISLEKGEKAANKYALGVALIILPQALVAVLLTSYIAENPQILETLEKAGIVVFIILSLYFYREFKKDKIKVEGVISTKETPLLRGLTLSLLNMFAIPFFCGVVVALDAYNFFSFHFLSVSFFIIGAALGTFSILYVYVKYAAKIQKKTGKLTKDINLILAILTGVVAIFTIIKQSIL